MPIYFKSNIKSWQISVFAQKTSVSKTIKLKDMSIIIPDVNHTVFDRWMAAVNEHDVDALCKLYSSNAILIPAVSNDIKYTQADIYEYFTNLLDKQDLKVELLNCHVKYENGHKIDTGNYLFTWNEDGELVSTKVRFSLLIDEHRIVVHHSSFWPEG